MPKGRPQFRAKLWNAARTGTETVYVWSINARTKTAYVSTYSDGAGGLEVESSRLSSFSAVTA